MKNFTKQILNKALFKPTRWILLALMFLLGTVSALAAGDASGSIGVYLKVNGTSTWYKVYNPGSWSMSCSGYAFDNAKDIPTALGDITSGLSLEGLGVIGWTNSGNDWVAAKIAYTITPGSVSNSYQVGNYGSAGSGKANVQCTSGNNRVTAVKSSVDLISGLNPNDYTLEITPYAQMQWKDGNNSDTYNSYTRTAKSVTFTIPGYSTTTGSHSFGEVDLGEQKTQTIDLTHYGSDNTATVSTTGTNEFTATVTKNGDNKQTLKVTFKPTSVAQNKTATVTVTDAYNKTYTLTVTGTGKQACEEPTSVSITRGTPATGNICQGSTIDLTATVSGGSGDISYKWEKVSGTDWSVSANSTSLTCTVTAGTGDGKFKITATRCNSSVTKEITLTADAKSVLELKANPTICQGSSIVLSEYVQSSTGTVKWYSNSAKTTEITNPTEARTPQSSPTSYYARATSGVCSSVDKTLTVKLSPKPDITLKSAPTICNGTTVTFANYVNTSTGTVTWHTKSDFSDAAITSAKPSQTTTYYAKASSGDCTPATASLKVTVNDKPAVPTLSVDKTSLVSPDKATLTAGNTTNGLTYTLYNGETPGESQVSEGRDLTFKAGDAGSYTVKVTNSCGTSTSDVVTITVCTPQTNEFRHANSSYNQLANQPTYYPGDKAYFVSTIDCCLTGTWSNNLQKGEEGWWTGLTGKTPKFSMTLTRAGNFTITNMATNGCTQDKNVLVNLDFTITALSQVTNANGTASGADIALTWKHSANHTKVMVVRYPTAGTETIPAGGQSYSAGNTLGEGTVVYVGTSESYTDKNLPAGASYKYYFYTVNNNYYSDGVVLNMSSCPIPAKPILSSTAITACNGECTAQGYITINNMNDYKDDTYTFELGSSVVTPDANGRLGINSTAYTQYTVTVTNSCGNPNSATVDIAINDNKPTITGATYTQPGKDNAITLTAANGILADWSVDNGGDLSQTSKSNTTDFSADANGTYIITADNGGCTDTHVVTVSDAFYIWVRNAKKGETAYNNFYHSDQNSDKYRGGEMFYAECDALPTDATYTTYNEGGREADLIQNDCDGYTWYGFRASADVISGEKYFYVHAKNNINTGGWYTHTVPTKVTLTSDVYYTLCETSVNNCNEGSKGWKIVSASAPYAGPVVHATDAIFNKNNFADFAALYVTDCSGKELKSYQWQYSATENGEYENYSSVCTYVGKKTEQGDAGKTNNIRPNVAGWYRCTATYNDDSFVTSAALEVTATSGTTKADFNSNLPVIMVNTGSNDFPSCPVSGETASKNAEKMKKKLSVDVKILFDGSIVYDRKARMAYRGSSSLNFLKKSYAFCPGDANCGDADKGEDYVKTAKLNMLDIGEAADKDWVLYAAAADPSMLRNRMVFETYQAMRSGEWGVKSRYVELIINGEYKGVYLMMDKITQNKKRVNVEWDVKDETKRGFILKFDKTDVADRSKDYPDGDEKTFLSKYSGKHDIGTYDTTNDQAFEIEYPEKGDIEDDGGNWYDVINFIQGMINNFETALSAGEYQKVQQIIDYESWADWFILSEYTKNVDAFRASCVFVYDGNKIKATPLWDQELSFNNQSVHANRYTNDAGNKGCQSAIGLLIKNDKVYTDGFAAPFWFTGKLAGGKGTEKLAEKTFAGALLNDPCFVQMVKNRWAAHKTGALSATSLTALITKYENELTSEVRTREANFWNGKSRNTLSCSWNSNTTGYYDDTYEDAKADITAWISDNNASTSGTGRRKGLEAAISALEGTGLDISISPASIETTPWVPVVIQVQNETGYEYTLTYTEGELDKQPNIIIEKSGDTYKYHIPRPWPAGDEQVEDERADINYGIKATLQVGDGNVQCGSSSELPSATATITLKDEENDDCEL